MRILHIAYIYPPTLEVADGITNVVHNITKELARRGHHVAVYTSDMLDLHGKDYLDATNLVINGVNVHYSRSLLRYKTFIVTPSMISLLSRSITAFDIIHIHDCRSFQGIGAYLFASTRGIPYVYQPHGSYLSSLPDSLTQEIARVALDKLASTRIFQNATKVLALSRAEAYEYRGAGMPEKKIEILPNGIDVSEYNDLPPKGSFKEKFGILENKKIILYLGRIHRTKGIGLLIKAYAYLVKKMRRNDSVLIIAGPDDGYVVEAKSLADSLGVSDSVLFVGFISNEDKLRALVDAKTFVTPSFFGFPMTFLEACVAGTPIITTTLGDELEWIDNNVGYVTRPTHYDLARAIHHILSDDDLSEKFSVNCRKLVKSEFSLERAGEKLERIYREAIDGKGYDSKRY